MGSGAMLPGLVAMLILWRLRQTRRLTIRAAARLGSFSLGCVVLIAGLQGGVLTGTFIGVALPVAFVGFAGWLLISKERRWAFLHGAPIRW